MRSCLETETSEAWEDLVESLIRRRRRNMDVDIIQVCPSVSDCTLKDKIVRSDRP